MMSCLFSLILRYTSIQSYHLVQKYFKLPSLSVISKLKSGRIDTTKALIALRSNGSISNDVIILFDEIILQQCDQHSRGKVEGSDANGNLITGIVCYMVFGTKSNVPYFVRAVPKVNLSGQWRKNELETTIDFVMQAGFSVNMAVE